MLAANEAYDPATDTWSVRAPMPTPRKGVALAVLNNRIYAIAGHDGAVDVSTVEEYNPATDVWVPKTGLGTTNYRFAAGAVAMNGAVYVFGGCSHLDAVVGRLSTVCDSPRLAWSVDYNSPANSTDEGRSVALDSSGSVYVAGFESRPDLVEDDNWLLRKYSPLGVLEWGVSYNAPASSTDRALSVAVGPSGTVVAVGAELRTDEGQDFNWLIRAYDAVGGPLWTRSYSGAANGEDKAVGVAVDAGGTIYVTGYETDIVEGFNWLTMALAPDGALLWTRSFAGFGASDDRAAAVTVDSSGSLFVVGTSGADGRVIKYDRFGVEQWAQPFGAGANGHAYAVTTDAANSVYVAGVEDIFGQATNWRIRQFSHDGIPGWLSSYDDPAKNLDVAYGIAPDPVGGFIVVGAENRADLTGQFNNWRINRYATDGSLMWGRDYNNPGSNQDYAY
ncbi:MAG: hypothetical protein AAB368_05400, partial [bacterium]